MQGKLTCLKRCMQFQILLPKLTLVDNFNYDYDSYL